MERLTAPGVDEYLHGLFPAPDPVLAEMESLGIERGFPIVGPLVGGLLEILARTIGATRILELGSGFGYSAAWFARGVAGSGHIVLTDGKEENLEEARVFLARAGHAHEFEFVLGDALDRLRRPAETWDIIFCDVDKHAYPQVIDPAVERLRPGGLLIYDNMLWSGRVFTEPAPGDVATEAVREAGRRLAAHPALRTTILPVRDGVSVSVRL